MYEFRGSLRLCVIALPLQAQTRAVADIGRAVVLYLELAGSALDGTHGRLGGAAQKEVEGLQFHPQQIMGE
jgi:hypothetical protein